MVLTAAREDQANDQILPALLVCVQNVDGDEAFKSRGEVKMLSLPETLVTPSQLLSSAQCGPLGSALQASSALSAPGLSYDHRLKHLPLLLPHQPWPTIPGSQTVSPRAPSKRTSPAKLSPLTPRTNPSKANNGKSKMARPCHTNHPRTRT